MVSGLPFAVAAAIVLSAAAEATRPSCSGPQWAPPDSPCTLLPLDGVSVRGVGKTTFAYVSEFAIPAAARNATGSAFFQVALRSVAGFCNGTALLFRPPYPNSNAVDSQALGFSINAREGGAPVLISSISQNDPFAPTRSEEKKATAEASSERSNFWTLAVETHWSACNYTVAAEPIWAPTVALRTGVPAKVLVRPDEWAPVTYQTSLAQPSFVRLKADAPVRLRLMFGLGPNIGEDGRSADVSLDGAGRPSTLRLPEAAAEPGGEWALGLLRLPQRRGPREEARVKLDAVTEIDAELVDAASVRTLSVGRRRPTLLKGLRPGETHLLRLPNSASTVPTVTLQAVNGTKCALEALIVGDGFFADDAGTVDGTGARTAGGRSLLHPSPALYLPYVEREDALLSLVVGQPGPDPNPDPEASRSENVVGRSIVGRAAACDLLIFATAATPVPLKVGDSTRMRAGGVVPLGAAPLALETLIFSFHVPAQPPSWPVVRLRALSSGTPGFATEGGCLVRAGQRSVALPVGISDVDGVALEAGGMAVDVPCAVAGQSPPGSLPPVEGEALAFVEVESGACELEVSIVLAGTPP
jgi:hypothetical protein